MNGGEGRRWQNAGIYTALHKLSGEQGEPEALTIAMRWFVSVEEMLKVANESQRTACMRLLAPIEQFVRDIRQAPVDREDK